MHKLIIVEQLDRKHYVNRDQMGGLGIGALSSKYFFAKLIGNLKRRSIRVPNLAIPQMVACLKQAGHQVQISIGLEKISKDTTAVIIPTSMVACNEECKFALKVRREFPNVKIVFTGIFSTLYPEKFLPYADVVVSGEPEAYCMQLREDLGQGVVKSERIEDLESLPIPDWSESEIKDFNYKPILTRYPMAAMLTSKSCVYSCRYCPYPLSYGRLRRREVEHVIQEMKMLKEKHGVKSILFRDPLFTFNKKRSAELFQRMIDERLDFQWVCETRLDHLDEDLIILAKKAGMVGVNVGVESGNLDILKDVNRKVIAQDWQKTVIDVLRKHTIWITGFYILGHENDTLETMDQTFRFSKHLNTPVAQFTINTPIPHAPEFKQMQDKLMSSDFEDYSFFKPVVKMKHLDADQVERRLSRFLAHYYLRPSYLWTNLKFYFRHWRAA